MKKSTILSLIICLVAVQHGLKKTLFFLIILLTQTAFAQTKDSSYYRVLKEPGVRFIPVDKGKYKVFTQKVGSGNIKLLLLHGGPANTHEYFENFADNLKNKGIAFYYYDQLGSYYSDQPKDSTIWNVDRFVDEVEEVRQGLHLDDFYLLGHSWGAFLAELYAAKYPGHLKGVILSNVPVFLIDSAKVKKADEERFDTIIAKMKKLQAFRGIPEADIDSTINIIYNDGAGTIKNENLAKLIKEKGDSIFYTYNIRTYPQLPEPLLRNIKHINRKDRDDNKMVEKIWKPDYITAMGKIRSPVLLIGGAYDRMNEALYPDMKKQFTQTKVRIYICPEGSHFSMWDDTENYFREIIRFLKEVESNTFNAGKVKG